jgi:hypothetical protein
MKRAAFLALALGLLTSTAQAGPVKLADKAMDRVAAGGLVEFPAINTNIATGVQNTVLVNPQTALAVAAFGSLSAAENTSSLLAGNIGITGAGFFPTP